MKITYDLILHGRILLSCSFFVNFQERIKKQESSSIGKSKSLDPPIVSVCCRESSYLKATLKKIHAFGKHALMVASIDENRPKSGYSCNFIQEEQIHLAMICLQIVSIVSVENQAIDAPIMITLSLLFFFLSLSEYVVQGIIKWLIRFLNDRSPIRNDCESERHCFLHQLLSTVGIYTSN